MTLGMPIGTPFFGSVATSIQVPGVYPVALAGRAFLLDLKSGQFRHQTIPSIRQQSDTSDRPGEQSLNPSGFWRRAQESWHLGAGQTYLDREESSPFRFRSSKGMDVFTKNRMGLLRETESKWVSPESNLQLVVAGGFLYEINGTALRYTQDITVPVPVMTTVTGTPATTPLSLTTDGYNIYSAHGANGIYKTTRGAAATASYVTGTIWITAFVNGRLMAAAAGNIYNILTTGALPAALFTHPNTDWNWTDFAEGPTHIYISGHSGDKSAVYKLGIKQDGSGLDAAPTVAAPLPDGEMVRSLQPYLGTFLLLGTDRGWRLCRISGDGNLVVGVLNTTPFPVLAFEPQDRFVWYGWTAYDATSTGLGRLDLSTDTAETEVPVPAYASDLMVDGQGPVTSIVTFQDRRVFAVGGQGVYAEGTDYVETGTLDTGFITYGLPEEKVALYLDVRHESLEGGTYETYLSDDSDEFTRVGIRTPSLLSIGAFPAGEARGEVFEIRQEITRDATDPTIAPVLRRHTLLANTTTDSGMQITAPLLLTDMDRIGNQEITRDPVDDYQHIQELKQSRNVVVWQEGDMSYSVTVEDFRWVPYQETPKHRRPHGYTGTCIVEMKTIAV